MSKALTFPPKSEWPKFSSAEWASDRRHAFLKFKRLLLSMFTTLDFVVGNENYGGDWSLLGDPACSVTPYPPPTSAPRRRVHRHTQLFLHRVLLDIFSDHCPSIISDYLETQAADDQEEAQAADHQEEAQAADHQEEAQAADHQEEAQASDNQEEVQASDDKEEEERRLLMTSRTTTSLPLSSTTTSTTTSPHLSWCTCCSPTRPMTTSSSSKQS